MRVEILQAGTGDCIWLSHNKRNVVIDGGKQASAILSRYSQLPSDESIDLLVITHIDSDHIAGVIGLVETMMRNGDLNRLKQVWFNFPKKEETEEYSISEGNKLSSLLCHIEGLNWCNNTSLLLGNPIHIGDIKLNVIAPNHDVAEDYLLEKPEELSYYNADWEDDLKILIENVDDDDIDDSCPNSQSIVIIVECEGKKALFPGDCTPKELCSAIQSYKRITGTHLKLDLMKLPHHGSLRNITKELLSEIDCSNFIVSTNVNMQYGFPHKEAIAKLISYRNEAAETVNVFFNYKEAHDVLGLTEEEQAENNLKLTVSHEFCV